MKTKIYEFDPVIYPFPLLVCRYIQGVTYKEIAGRFNQVVNRRTMQTFDEDDLRAYPTLTAKTICVVDKLTEQMYYLIILYRPKKIRWGIVSHEALHVVTMLCDWLGIKPPSATEDEAHAYLLQWVANCIGSVLEGHPERLKGKLLNQENNETEQNQSDAGGQD